MYSSSAREFIDFIQFEHFEISECIFVDFSRQYPFDNVINKLMTSPKLQYMAKHVIQGSYLPGTLPKKPLLLVIQPSPQEELKQLKNKKKMYKFLLLFNPATPVLVFMDISDVTVKTIVRVILVKARFYNTIFVGTGKLEIRMGSLKDFRAFMAPLPHPKILFKWFQKELRGSVITYQNAGEKHNKKLPTFKWMLATAAYLRGELREFHQQDGGPTRADIEEREDVLSNLEYDFRQVWKNHAESACILVPRGVPMGAFEVMLLPFEWQVWMLLLIVLTLAEVVKRVVPELFKNDPILLVVCGFERSNLHQAGRWEKIILHSLILLMFFMTSAFETKIISFMIDKPTAPSAKRLADFDKYGLSFRYNLAENPAAANHPVIGKYVVNDTKDYGNHWHKRINVAQYVSQPLAEFAELFSYDFDLGISWYYALDEKFMVYPVKIHYTALRSQFIETFQYTFVALYEAGILQGWETQFKHSFYLKVWRTRRQTVIKKEAYLVFDDMLLPWIALAIGHGISLLVLIAEIVEMKMKKRLCFSFLIPKFWNLVAQSCNNLMVKIAKLFCNKNCQH